MSVAYTCFLNTKVRDTVKELFKSSKNQKPPSSSAPAQPLSPVVWLTISELVIFIKNVISNSTTLLKFKKKMNTTSAACLQDSSIKNAPCFIVSIRLNHIRMNHIMHFSLPNDYTLHYSPPFIYNSLYKNKESIKAYNSPSSFHTPLVSSS